jgi:hypothetical protein
MIFTNFNLVFRLSATGLPTVEEQYHQLWRFACSLKRASIGIDEWHPPATTPEDSLLNKAFDDNGPTRAALAMAKAEKQAYPNMRSLGVWNGKEKSEAIAFSSTLVVSGGVSDVGVQSAGIPALGNSKVVSEVLQDALAIWPAAYIEAGPYKYYSQYQVFKDRPGVGWMLYLPRAISVQQAPEAQALVPVIDGQKQSGTIVISVAGEPFDVDNPEHVKRANAIEIRLADQDLLPRYVDV